MPFSETPTKESKWIIFQGVIEENFGQRFFTTYNPNDKDPTKGYTGEIWYAIVGYTNTIAEAEMKLFGRVITDSKD